MRTIRAPGILYGLLILVIPVAIVAIMFAPLDSLPKLIVAAIRLILLLIVIIIISVITWFKANALVLSASEYQARFDKLLGARDSATQYSITDIEAAPLKQPPQQLLPGKVDDRASEESEP